MASGLAALLDDVAAIAKIAATSLDDVVGAAGKAGVKAAGVVVDDTAVTPGFAMGFTPDRELPIVWKIALGSLRNKFLFILPATLVLGALAPWAVTPILMLGGAYLCFEATEKVLEAIRPHPKDEAPEPLALGSAELEREKVAGAIRTDLILSSEIMAIALASVREQPFLIQAASLAVTALLLTVGVYGVVGLIVKLDDIGLHLARRRAASLQRLGRLLVRGAVPLLEILSVVGTAAMLWVGGGIILHGLHEFHAGPLPDLAESLRAGAQRTPLIGPLAGWVTYALASAVVGMTVGAAIVWVVHVVRHRLRRRSAAH
jgi:predicted DNA repair protein MutK